MTTWWWVLFGALALALPMVDLLVQRRPRRQSLQRAAAWSVAWVSLGLLFAFVVGVARGHPAALAYVTAYLVEVSLSVDNLFVFAALFAYFGVAHEHQHRVLFWGIFGAIVMRGLFIFAGLSLIARFHWLIYLLGVVLLATGARLGLLGEAEAVHPERNVVVRWLSRVLPIDRSYHGDRFAVRLPDGWCFTPLVLVLVAIESTDVIFAVDSVPAVLGVSRDAFVVYTSNVFAVMGLRSLYFVLAGALRSLRFLRPALALILVLIGVKMILADLIEVPTAVSLAVVVLILLAGAGLSLLLPQHKGGRTPPG